ncbi:MAG: hypothetical protein EA395_11255 [Phormidium sp. GEM2.Bin31]|nr:MAG: hypothetical protein EA395_11255 [Phormidium sp. GEM2.Bin31]
MTYHKTLALSFLTIALSLGACNTVPEDSMTSNGRNPESDPEEVVDTPEASPSPSPTPTESPPPTSDEGDDTVAVSPPQETPTHDESAQAPSPPPPWEQNLPEVATIEETQVGDLMCYVTVTDLRGNTSVIGAQYQICDNEDQFLRQTVGLGYTETTVADCESNEPCGRTRQEMLLSDVINIGKDWYVLSDGTWRVMVGQMETWDGVNNTGELTYYGCDDQNNCLALEGGVVSCRRGVCGYGWQHGDHLYSIATPIVEDGGAPATLRVFRQGEDIHESEEILNVPNMEVVNSKTDPS